VSSPSPSFKFRPRLFPFFPPSFYAIEGGVTRLMCFFFPLPPLPLVSSQVCFSLVTNGKKVPVPFSLFFPCPFHSDEDDFPLLFIKKTGESSFPFFSSLVPEKGDTFFFPPSQDRKRDYGGVESFFSFPLLPF